MRMSCEDIRQTWSQFYTHTVKERKSLQLTVFVLYRRCCCFLPWSLTTIRHQRILRAPPSNTMASDLSSYQICAVSMETLPHCGHQWSLQILCVINVSLCFIIAVIKETHPVWVAQLAGKQWQILIVLFFFFDFVFSLLTFALSFLCNWKETF